MKQQTFWVIVLASALTVSIMLTTGCAGCAATVEEAAGDSNLLTMMTWNVHNLFDGEDNGNEYDEFLQSSGWNAEKYRGRINSLTDAIKRIEPQPDIIMLQEIESLKILEDLSRSLNSGYSWSHFAGNPGSAIGLGIISRRPLLDAKIHSITIDRDTAPRPVLEARIQNLVIFVCHWKSKIGGDEATESTRRACARVILRRVKELQENESDLGIVIAGDLNQNHDEFYRQNASMICALLPDDIYCAQASGGMQKDFIVISKSIPPEPVNFPEKTITFYSPWIKELENGSYFYKNNWETIDHFLLSPQLFGSSSWKYEKTKIINIAPFANPSGIPAPYSSRTGLGMSDHLPLMLFLTAGGQ